MKLRQSHDLQIANARERFGRARDERNFVGDRRGCYQRVEGAESGAAVFEHQLCGARRGHRPQTQNRERLHKSFDARALVVVGATFEQIEISRRRQAHFDGRIFQNARIGARFIVSAVTAEV